MRPTPVATVGEGHVPSRDAQAKWAVIAALVAVDGLWLIHGGMRLAPTGLLRVGGAILAFGAIGVVYERWRPEERLAELAQSAVRLLAFFATIGVLSYLVATTGMPVADDLFARADRALGFDWVSWCDFVRQRPLFHALLHLAYLAALPQIAIITAYLSLTGQPERNREFLWLMMISLLIIVPISGLLPAFNASVYYDAPGFLAHMPDFVALRTGRFTEVDLSHLQGLISFPSFHTTLGLLFPYAVRRWRVPLLIAALVNVAMIAAVPTEGGHYLVDVLAGAAVAAIAILGAAAIEARLLRRAPAVVLAAADAD